MNEQYLITKCVLNEDNLLIFFPTEIFDSINQLMEYSQDFFNNRKYLHVSNNARSQRNLENENF